LIGFAAKISLLANGKFLVLKFTVPIDKKLEGKAINCAEKVY